MSGAVLTVPALLGLQSLCHTGCCVDGSLCRGSLLSSSDVWATKCSGGDKVFPQLGVQAELCSQTQQACEHLKEAHFFSP